MFTEVMVTNIYVFGTWAKLGEPGKFKSTRIVFKDFAIHVGLGADNRNVMLPHLLDEIHDWNDIPQCHGHGNVFSLSGRQGNLGLELRSLNGGASCIKHNPSTSRLGSAWINISKGLVPISREVSITVAFKSFFNVGLETYS